MDNTDQTNEDNGEQLGAEGQSVSVREDCQVGIHKLSERHSAYVHNQIAGFNTSPTLICKLLADPTEMDLHNLQPVEVTVSSMSARIRRIAPPVLADQRAKYLSLFNDIPLAHKKIRVLKLQGMYHKADTGVLTRSVLVREGKDSHWETVQCSDVEEMQQKQSILRDIANEMGTRMEPKASITNNTVIITAEDKFKDRLAKTLEIGAKVLQSVSEPIQDEVGRKDDDD